MIGSECNLYCQRNEAHWLLPSLLQYLTAVCIICFYLCMTLKSLKGIFHKQTRTTKEIQNGERPHVGRLLKSPSYCREDGGKRNRNAARDSIDLSCCPGDRWELRWRRWRTFAIWGFEWIPISGLSFRTQSPNFYLNGPDLLWSYPLNAPDLVRNDLT